jgi:hypothetical protein
MMNTTWRGLLLSAAIFAICFAVTPDLHATIVFKDDFDRADSSTIGATAGPGSGTWTETITTIPAAAIDGDVTISSNRVVVTHGNNDAIYQLSTTTAGFLSPWPASNKLSDAPGKVTWTVNMQSSRLNLSGVAPGANGIGVALVATNTSLGAVGNNGYGLYWGQSGGTDPIHLMAFAGNGVTSVTTDIVVGSGTTFGNVAAEYLSIRVEYDPTTNTWELFGRNDGASAFADPATGGGYLSLGSGVNSTHVGTAMNNVGFFGSYTTLGAANVFRHDNFAIDVVPEPSSVALGCAAIVGMIVFARRRRVAV